MNLIERATNKFRRVFSIPEPLPKLDLRLAAMEKVFRSPPLNKELVDAIKLISPQYNLKPTERDRRFWEADQNGACWGEYEALRDILLLLPHNGKVLEIGPGMGRSLVFFAKKLGWSGQQLYAFEGNGEKTRYTNFGPRFEDLFCGNIPVLRHVLDFNGIRDVTILDAVTTALGKIPGKYDLIYSFYCIGFHWALEYFIDDIKNLLSPSGVAIFTTTSDFRPFDRLQDFSYQTLDWKPVWPKDAMLKFVVLKN